MEWSEDLVLQLIEAYRERPVLWDVGHKLFKIKTKRNDVWEELATIFNTDRYEVKKKINSLLASFRRERRKVMCTTSGIGADEVSQSKWFAFKSLLFLMDKNKLRQSQCTDEAIEQDDFEESGAVRKMENETLSTNNLELDHHDHAKGHKTKELLGREKHLKHKQFLSPTKNFPPNKKRIVEDPRVAEAYKILKEVSERHEKRDDCFVFGEHVARKLRGYDSRTCAIVQHHINNILFEADMGKYLNGNLYNQQPVPWESASGKNSQHGSSTSDVTSGPPSPQPQHSMDVITMRLGKTEVPSSPQLSDMTKEPEPPSSFSLVAVKCEVEDDAQNFVDAKTDVKDEIAEEQEVKTEGDKCSGPVGRVLP